MNIVLIGFRCSGKTTIGKMLSDRLSMGFIDADERIEKKCDMTIREIFQTKGESHFRLLESDILGDLEKLDGKIIATGGGAVLKYKNMQGLKRNGVIILLDVEPDVAYERIKRDKATRKNRPPLTDKNLLTEINEQIELRRPYYRNVADFVVKTSEKPVEDIVSDIIKILKNKKVINID
ncbi:MAG: hypothetical protein A2W05_11645 [Candidatus Schekmanbacteria bacterium RBG_16_38_10]|uniref:Shikimate kinase n=1 Tax=Candidatus Schekmanbacteria bacterium RBG_16_38_10 TaxID=1817879 RepID=A0A1F7RUX3_9BACT|nr:MAG: hypothetical protein A2W05_11645 [Candidatus Schekmanbacteria bacterium RBG_16_38_10]